MEVLEAKGFGLKWIRWIKDLLHSGQTSVMFNGNLGSYFKCKRGLRQGDPISPFLFDLAMDALSAILQNAMNAGFLKGLGSFDNNRSIWNLNFADDTLIFLKADIKMVENFKNYFSSIWKYVRFENSL